MNDVVDVWMHNVRHDKECSLMARLGLAHISEKLREAKLRWFRHVKRRQLTTLVRIIKNLIVGGKKG